MATKKQKREAALAKREQFMKEERERGLEALASDRRRREAEEEAAQERIRGMMGRYRAILAQHGIHD